MKRANALLPFVLAVGACHHGPGTTRSESVAGPSPAHEDTRDETRRAQEEASRPYSIGNVTTDEMAQRPVAAPR